MVGAVPSTVSVIIGVSCGGALLNSTFAWAADERAGGQPLLGFGGVGHPTLANAAAGVGLQQALGRIRDQFAGVRVDGLQQPGDRAAVDVDAGADAEDEALALREIEIAVERAQAAGNLHLQIADLQIAQPEAARVEVRVELFDDAHLVDRRGRRWTGC